ncbi:hypothetical protein EAE96_010126 [Botrytis aclada]|nr:hypothetical protein EAE96_010126 [Botrytis aclada]
MGNNKNRRKNSNSGGGANDSRRNNHKGGKGGKGRNNHDGNEGHQIKGRVPQEFLECRICQREGHWESACRDNPAGAGKRGRDLPECRECGGNHWEDQCRTWKTKNGGKGNDGNNNKGNGRDSSSDSDAGDCRAPSGEDITQFFPSGKYPSRPCRKCKEPGHWNNACEREGFHPVGNPNPAEAGARKVSFPDGQRRGQIGSPYNQYHSPPGTEVRSCSVTASPSVDFGYAKQPFDTAMEIRIKTNTPIANTTPTPIPPTTSPTPLTNPISPPPQPPTPPTPPTPTPPSTKPATAPPSAPSATTPPTNPTTASPTAGCSLAPTPSGVPILISTIPPTQSIRVRMAIGKVIP